MYEATNSGYFCAQFSPQSPKHLSVLSDNDLQIFEYEDDDYKLMYVNRLGSKYDSIRCTEWSRDPSNPLTIAAGFGNGRVCLISYGDETDDQMSRVVTGNVVKEFNFRGSLKTKRRCNALAWSKNDPSLLACGYDWVQSRHTASQYSIVVWDVNKETKVHGAEYPVIEPYGNDANFHTSLPALGMTLDKGISKRNRAQVVKNEKHAIDKKDDSSSLIWLNDENNKLISGSNKGSLKICDLQSSSPIEINAHSKRINSIKLSPFNPYVIASCTEDEVKIFDTRKPKHALIQINHDIKDFEFSNFHSYILATIHNKTNSNHVKFWNISSAT